MAKIAAYVIEKDAPALMTIHFLSVDHFEHMEGRRGEAVKKAIADADSAVGIVIDAIKYGDWKARFFLVGGSL